MHWIWKNIIISTIVGSGLFTFILYSETGDSPSLTNHGPSLVTALFLFNLVGAGVYSLSRRYNKLLPWNTQITTRFILEVLSGMILVGMACLVYTLLILRNIDVSESENTFWQEYWDGAVKFGIVSLVMIYVYSLVSFSIYSYNQYSVHQIDKIRGESNQLNLQFEALKSQLSPHFLFNALNTISSLIYKDRTLTEDFIRRLAFTYRYILRTNDQQLITLDQELEMLRSYFFMQQIKYEECIELKENLTNGTLSSWIPPLTLQMLLENALKHNLICEEKKLIFSLESTNKDHLVVKNNIIPKSELLKIGNSLVDRPPITKSHKIGLDNIRSRYAFFTKRKIEITNDQQFTVKLPLIYRPLENENVL